MMSESRTYPLGDGDMGAGGILQTNPGDAPKARASFQVDAAVLAQFKATAEQVGPSMFEVGSNLVRWFNVQHVTVQRALAGRLDEGVELIYAEALERRAAELRKISAGRLRRRKRPDA
jgi:hypothetical protein